MHQVGRSLIASILAIVASAAQAEVDPKAPGARWWDASRAERIGFSDHAAAACRSRNCDSLQIRSCLNDTLKPPVAPGVRNKTIAEVTDACIAGLKSKPD